MTDVDVVVDGRALLGEGPVWDDVSESLVWVDILRREIHRYHPAAGTDTATRLPVTVAAARPATDGSLVLAAGLGIARYDEPTEQLDWLAQADVGDRMNDATCDPAGRFWAGTLSVGRPGAALYRWDGEQLARVLDGVGLSNGLGWSPDHTTAYYVDTLAEQVFAFDADVAAGTLANRRVFADLHDVPGRPDGLAVDAEGGVWVATAKGGAIRRFLPSGRPDHVIELGTPGVTSCAFGGPDLADLYVTTMCLGLGEPELREYPLAGGLIRIPDVGVRGVPATRFAA